MTQGTRWPKAGYLPLFVFDSLSSTCPKKIETEKWPKAADSPLLENLFHCLSMPRGKERGK